MLNVITKIYGTLFGLIFAGAGFFMFSQTSFPLLQSWYNTRNWQPHHAEILSTGGSSNETTAVYRYHINGFYYEGSRVYISEFRDNTGSFHQDLQQRLGRLKRAGKPIRIWVNPQDHTQAVIDNTMRWGLFTLMTSFCSIFILSGLAVSLKSIFGKHKKRITSTGILELRKEWLANKTGSPDSFLEFLKRKREEVYQSQVRQQPAPAMQGEEPWLLRNEWKHNSIRSEAKSGIAGMWIIALLWNSVSTPLLFVLPEELRSANYPALLILLFPIIGLFLLYRAVILSREYFKFGIIPCTLDPFPGSIGGNVGGTLVLKNKAASKASCTVELECVFSYVSGSGKNRSRKEDVKWAEAGTPKTITGTDSTRLIFRFDAPADLPESDTEQRGSYHFWRLKLHSELPGVDLQRSYNIPVFKTFRHSEKIRHDLSRQMEEVRENQAERSRLALETGHFDKAGLSGAVRIKKLPGGIHLIHPMFRNKALSLFALVFGGIFSGAVIAFAPSFSRLSLFSVISLIFSLPFALVGLAGLVAALYLPLNSLRVTIAGRTVKTLRMWLFLPLYYKEWPSSEISGCIVKESSSRGQGVKRKRYFKILAKTVSGEKITIAEGIEGEDLAQHMKDYLFKRIKAGY